MKKIILLGLIVFPFHVVAAPKVSDFEKRVVSATKWSEVGDQLKEVLPGNVVKDFIQSTEGIPYPTAKKQKKGVEFFQSNGLRALMEFKKDGVVSINKQDWKFEPLASVDSEVKRLEVFLSGEHKRVSSLSYFGLIPDANAGVAAGAAGIAHIAFARGTEHKAIACGGENLSEGLKNDCPLMAVGMRPMVQLASASGEDLNQKMYPIELKCPSENDGTLELYLKNKKQIRSRLKVSFEGLVPNYVSYAESKGNEQFKVAYKVDLINFSADEIHLEEAKSLANAAKNLNIKICNADENTKSTYMAKLKANNEALKQQAFNSQGSESTDGQSAL